MITAGIDIGGTKSAVVIGRLSGDHWEILSKEQFATIPMQPDKMLSLYGSSLETQMTSLHLKPEDLKGIGISCGGPLNSKEGRILSPPNLPGWDDVPVVDFFRKRYHLPCYLQNDANACAVAEWKYGAGKGSHNMAYLTFGTGLGAGLILNNQLYVGTNDMAGEIGHVRLTQQGPAGYGKIGSVEGYCSGGGIAQLGRTKVLESLGKGEKPALLERCGSLEAITAKEIGDLADEGDTLCREIYHISGEKLGQALSILVDILNLEVIVIGSIYARSRHLLVESMEMVMRRECLPVPFQNCQILPSALGEQVGDIAALSVSLGISNI